MFKKLYVITIFIALNCFFVSLAAAQNLNKEQILEGLALKYTNVNAIQANYKRVTSAPSTDDIFKSSSSQEALGVLSWQRPDKLLLEQKKPSPESMVTDGSTVWWHISAEKLVYRYKNIDVAGQLKPLLSFLGGLDSLNADFNVSSAPLEKSRPTQYGLRLVPKNGPDGGVEQLTIWCDNKFVLTGFRLSSVTGETTDFYLNAFNDKPKFSKSHFSFNIPKGTEVIEEEGY